MTDHPITVDVVLSIAFPDDQRASVRLIRRMANLWRCNSALFGEADRALIREVVDRKPLDELPIEVLSAAPVALAAALRRQTPKLGEEEALDIAGRVLADVAAQRAAARAEALDATQSHR